ncbi:alkaline shock response membrane anchor protein AmaP [Carboxydothermus pertinax]|uniref:Alkaline shock response membrane anchor protein AmaP n=1 Tax=Carboxydothermus pertinax TaxID=870242 RepID=A0A1L8CTW5_9THEO|nr:alkaline shock response membrane anchor protein AmaP [Carboxydothermus pertinax]GAV22368.1 hypothetical protein cpu_08780 [Carboxydothermus pertinax]
MNFVDRSILFLYGLVTVFLLLIFLLTVLGWHLPIYYLKNVFFDVQFRTALFAFLLLLILLGLKVIALSLKAQRKRDRGISLEGELGQINVTFDTISALIKRVAGKIPGVKEVRPILEAYPQGLGVQVLVRVLPDLNIPEISKRLQEEIDSYIQESLGIKLLNIKIKVEDIAQEIRPRVE